MPRRLEADDEVRRFRGVYLGPDDFTLPWAARYSAYATGAVIFITVLLVEAVLPGVSVGVPPLWELVFTIIGTTAVMTAVDHDKPLGPVVKNAVQAARVPRPHPTDPKAQHRAPRRTAMKVTTQEQTP